MQGHRITNIFHQSKNNKNNVYQITVCLYNADLRILHKMLAILRNKLQGWRCTCQ